MKRDASTSARSSGPSDSDRSTRSPIARWPPGCSPPRWAPIAAWRSWPRSLRRCARAIVAPALYLIERLAWETRRRAQRQVFQRLTAGLGSADHARLDALLTVAPGWRQTRLAWLRQPPGTPSPPTILARIERLTSIRALGLDHTLARQVHQNRLLRLAREGGRYSPAFLARFEPTRRYATLVAFLIETAATLTDQILAMHDRLMTGYLRRSEQAQATQFHASGKVINEAASDSGGPVSPARGPAPGRG